ncbi:MAG: protein kinase domain-containing protein [Desulforhopalus sp.]
MDTLNPGERIDGFRITRMLHDGEMARVYEAVDLLYNSTIALKIPLDDILNRPILYYQYQNEETIGAHLDHDRIVRFLRRHRSKTYLVMAYIPGENLRTFLHKKKRLSIEAACSFTLAIADGLKYLHKNKIIHLDIKPDNVMVTPGLDVKILDFGLANYLGGVDLMADDLPGPKGTPYYIAPEQVCGRRDYKESDVYSLATMFYEMLTGELPFKRSKKLARVRDRIRRDPIPPRYYRREIPPSMQEIILKSLAKSPHDRYTIEGFIAALKNHDEMQTGVGGALITKPMPLHWFFKFTGCARITGKSKRQTPIKKTGKQHILGCIVDHEYSDLVIERVKREALMRGGEITLLTVIQEGDDEHLVKYITELEGRSLSNRLNSYISTLQRYNLDPVLRIRRGRPGEVITETAAGLPADIIILGPPRSPKGLASIFGESVIQKVIKGVPATVLIAETVTPAYPPFFTRPEELTPLLLSEIDLFLLDTWVQHLNWFSETAHGLLDSSEHYRFYEENICNFGLWLAGIPADSHLKVLISDAAEAHKNFHRAVDKMAEQENLETMVSIYHQKALPLSNDLKECLENISRRLRLEYNSTHPKVS